MMQLKSLTEEYSLMIGLKIDPHEKVDKDYCPPYNKWRGALLQAVGLITLLLYTVYTVHDNRHLAEWRLSCLMKPIIHQFAS